MVLSGTVFNFAKVCISYVPVSPGVEVVVTKSQMNFTKSALPDTIP